MEGRDPTSVAHKRVWDCAGEEQMRKEDVRNYPDPAAILHHSEGIQHFTGS